MSTVFQDVRYAFRMALKKPSLTVAIVSTVGLGVGMSTSMFGVVDAVLMRPLPYPDEDRVVRIWQRAPGLGYSQFLLSEPEYFDYRERQASFEHFGVYRTVPANLTGGEEAIRINMASVSGGFFQIPAIRAQLGRTFLPEEDIAGNGNVAVLTHRIWKSYFGKDPEIVGKAVELDGRSLTVVGVMPADFGFPHPWLDVWVPLGLDGADPHLRQRHDLHAVARLKSGIAVREASSQINSVAQQLRREHPDIYDDYGDYGAYVLPLKEDMIAGSRPALLILMGAANLVLLIACMNATTVLLARTASRRRELAIRQALGATRRAIARQLVSENILLFLLGGGAGFLLAQFASDILISRSPGRIPRLDAATIDSKAMMFALGISLLTGFLFSLLPLLPFVKARLHEALEADGRSSTGQRTQRWQHVFVLAEIALSVVLLFSTGLLAKSVARVLDVELGYDTNNIVTFRVSLPATKYPQDHDVVAFYRELDLRVGSLPSVEAVGIVPALPLSGEDASTTVLVEELPPNSSNPDYPYGGLTAEFRTVNPDYFRALHIKVIRGRAFTESDNNETPLVAVVDETFAARAWPNTNPDGKRVALPLGPDEELRWHTVIGVVRHVKHYGPDAEGREQIYIPIPQFAPRFLSATAYVALRCEGDPLETLSRARTIVAQIDRDLPLFAVATMQERLRESTGLRRFCLTLLTVFAATSLLLAAVGVYGVVAYSVSQRTREIGIRVALGAQRGDVLRLVLRQGFVLALGGGSIGSAASFASSQLLSSQLYETSPTDPATFLGSAAVLLLAVLLAVYIPARRATKVDPMVALRYE